MLSLAPLGGSIASADFRHLATRIVLDQHENEIAVLRFHQIIISSYHIVVTWVRTINRQTANTMLQGWKALEKRRRHVIVASPREEYNRESAKMT